MFGNKQCVICGESFTGFGNNPWPVADHGECCDNCNLVQVIPARMFGLTAVKECPLNGNTENDCADCILGENHHFVGGHCVRRESDDNDQE